MIDTLLVTGIHREELSFGDRVATLLDRDRIEVMRIPKGISHARTGTYDLFYYDARHREIYLQLRQQVKGRYRLLIDLHSGVNDAERAADVYCRDENVLECLARKMARHPKANRCRLVKILTDSEGTDCAEQSPAAEVGARTLIPRQIWDDRSFIYVGLEVYLTREGEGEAEDWYFARDLIEIIRDCNGS